MVKFKSRAVIFRAKRMNKAQAAAVMAKLETDLERIRNQSFAEDIVDAERLGVAWNDVPVNATADDIKNTVLYFARRDARDTINGTFNTFNI